MLDDAEDDTGALVAVEVRERDAQDNGSLKCSGTEPGDHDKNHDHAGGTQSTTSCYHSVEAAQSLSHEAGCASSLSSDCGCAFP